MNNNCNLASLVARVKSRLKDSDYDEQDIKQFLNDAYFEIMNDGHYTFLEKCYQAFAECGGNLETPKDFQSVIQFTANNGKNTKPLEYMPYEQFLALSDDDSRKNYKYTIFANKLFYGLPTMPENEYYSLSLYYLARPIAMKENADMPMIPEEFSEALILGAMKRAEQLRDNFDYAQIYENERLDIIVNMKSRYCPRQQQGANRAKLPIRFNAGEM